MTPKKLKAIKNTPLCHFAESPDINDGALWRYVDLARFMDILVTKSLFFVRQENLIQLDPLEGTYTKGTYTAMENVPITVHGEGDPQKLRELSKRATIRMIPLKRRLLCISCWHQNMRESDAMWKIYARDNKGIAIRSSTDRFMTALEPSYRDKVSLGKVRYVDYFAEDPRNQIIDPAFIKDLSYVHENEVRAVVWDDTANNRTEEDWLSVQLSKGVSLPIDLEVLVEKVVLSPDAEDSYRDLLEQFARKFDVDVAIEISKYKTPIEVQEAAYHHK